MNIANAESIFERNESDIPIFRFFDRFMYHNLYLRKKLFSKFSPKLWFSLEWLHHKNGEKVDVK